jgi:hypothetical protein
MRSASPFVLLALVLAALALLPVACASSDDPGAGAPGGGAPSGGRTAGSGTTTGQGGGGTGGGSDPVGGCVGPLGPPVDPTTLPACCPMYGGAHCVESVPDNFVSLVDPCTGGGYCVPDDFIATGGVFTPTACTSVNGPGVCLSACIPEVGMYVSILPQDVCAADERCAPCVSPLNNMDTGACSIGFTCGGGAGGAGGGSTGSGGAPPATCPHEGPPVVDPTTFPPCPACGGGHCVPNALVPSAEATELASCDGTSTCVPDPIIASGGNFILPTCMSVAGFEGRCASVCIPQVASEASSLPQSTCASDEVCAPCYDPLTGVDTGICHLSCDPGPAGPPQTLPACCGGIGTCVPSSSVPSDKASNFDATGCSAVPGLLCVPDAFVPDATPPAGDVTNQSCTTGWLFQAFFGFDPLYADGVCLPKCMPEVGSQSFLVDQGSCGNGAYKCVPCNDPTNNGASTGACSN